MAITSEEFVIRLKEAAELLQREKVQIEFTALSSVTGEFKNRIFRDGKAVDGNFITAKKVAPRPRTGIYSKQWGDKRKENNHQVNFVNLTMDGGNLKNRIQPVHAGNEAQLKFTTKKSKLIAKGHEDYRKLKIFALNEYEADIVIKSALQQIRNLIQKKLNNDKA